LLTARWLRRSLLVLLPALCACPALCAQDLVAADQRYVVDIELQTIEDLQQLLERAEQLLIAGQVPAADEAAVIFVLHGPVLRSLIRENYLGNKRTVDLAASLSALGMIDIKACRTWMGSNNVAESELQPFVETVSYGPGEVQRLVRERNYLYF